MVGSVSRCRGQWSKEKGIARKKQGGMQEFEDSAALWNREEFGD